MLRRCVVRGGFFGRWGCSDFGGATGSCCGWCHFGGDRCGRGYVHEGEAGLGLGLYVATFGGGAYWPSAGAVVCLSDGGGVYTAISPIVGGGPAVCVFRPWSRGVYTAFSLLTTVVDASWCFGGDTPTWSTAYSPASSSCSPA
jgi:hypothetical protein